MNPLVVAEHDKHRSAIVLAGSGNSISYGELSDQMRRVAKAFLDMGLVYGDHIALMLPNGLDYHPICWGAWLAGLYFTPISTHLKEDEVEHLVSDSGSSLVICAPEFEEVMRNVRVRQPHVSHWLTTGPATEGFASLGEIAERNTPLETSADHLVGSDMLYSSGTTGRPKGIVPPLGRKRDDADPLSTLLSKLYGFSDETVYLNPAPLYHGSPLKFTMAVHRFGGTVVIMPKFDAEAALQAIQDHKVTHSQWVPTMLHRMYRLPDETKAKFDLSSHQVAVHAAAPCPPELKRAMLDWWGDILHEFYAGSEAVGYTAIGPKEWREKPGSVGKSVFGAIHVVDDEGKELPPGQIGQIYFSGGPKISYHNSPEKTASAYLPNGWFTMGDMGHLDADGYLYLADRADFMIITGGVNVYPKEIEDLLIMHPAIQDVAVFGVPNEDFGEEVKAVVQPYDLSGDLEALAEELLAFCREKLSRIKSPRTIDFVETLPRRDNGKLYKKSLREMYLPKAQS
jgi:long-chain acyl-CoA synthetase